MIQYKQKALWLPMAITLALPTPSFHHAGMVSSSPTPRKTLITWLIILLVVMALGYAIFGKLIPGIKETIAQVQWELADIISLVTAVIDMLLEFTGEQQSL